MSDEVKLTPEEVRQNTIDTRKQAMRERTEKGLTQGILSFTNEKLYEQSNPILRSSLFTVGKLNIKAKPTYNQWTEIFSLGSGSIQYRGPVLTVDHEVVLVRLLVLARGRSITKPVSVNLADVLRWLDLNANSGANYIKARRIIDDLGAAELKISSRPALQHLLDILNSPNLIELADGKFFQDLVKNRYSEHLKMIAQGLENNQNVAINLSFIETVTHNTVTKRMMINLDPLTTVFFDGVNTTLLPLDIWDNLDRYGKKLLPLIASHRDGVYPMKLERYHEFSGSKSSYDVVKRRFKSEQKKRFSQWEEKGYIAPGWRIEQNQDGDEIVSGLKAGDAVRIRSSLDIIPHEDTEDDIQRGSDEAMKQRLMDFQSSFEGKAFDAE